MIDNMDISESKIDKIASMVEQLPDCRILVFGSPEWRKEGKYIAISGETEYRCDGSHAGQYEIWVPVSLINASDEEIRHWLLQYSEQIKIWEQKEQKTKDLQQLEEKHKVLIQAITNLNDPQWLIGLKAHFNAKLQKALAETQVIKQQIEECSDKLNPEYDQLPHSFLDYFGVFSPHYNDIQCDDLIHVSGNFKIKEEKTSISNDHL